MSTEADFQMMRKIERAHFFSSKEQGLILKLYEEERDILTAKSNTTTASKQREEAWQRIADQINVVSDSGYKRTWQQVKVKYKNIVQTAKRKQIEMMRCEAELGPPSLSSVEDNMLHHRDMLRQDFFPGVHCIDQLSGHDNTFVNVAGHPVLLLPPVTKTEPESLSSEDTDMSESHIDGDLHNHNNFQESCNSAGAAAAGCGAEKQTDDMRALYCCYLKKEMENRDQEMAYRALKMRKLEKEILLLDKQLM